MKIDFHTHGKLAKKLPFSSQYTDWLVKEAKLAGLDAICLTEHFNTIGFQEIYEYIANTYEQDGDAFVCEGVKIFPGMEVDIAEGGHVLVIGEMDTICYLNSVLEQYKVKESFLEAKKLMELLKDYPILVGAAHPFREGGHIPELPREVLEQFDFIDLNGKDVAGDKLKVKEKIQKFSAELDCPYVAGSDTHQSFQYGCIYTEFEKELCTIKDIKEAILEGEYTIQISDYIGFQVKTARILKRSLKAIHELGGNYIPVLLHDSIE